MKILFLDFDGVLNSQKSFLKVHRSWIHRIHRFLFPQDREYRILEHLDKNAVKHLNTIVEKTNCSIVISSTWRRLNTLDEIRRLLKIKGFKYCENIIGKTEYLGLTCEEMGRGKEIEKWLNENATVDTAFSILDDDSADIRPMYPHELVKTDCLTGLQEHHANAVILLLLENDFTDSQRS